mmetsp:Transcript_30950/g.42563  ORF Transcript_30950/g.42563 Transcript_30950/m.42563 type:complete len:360 (+) Transcript_30950:73-1152(+)
MKLLATAVIFLFHKVSFCEGYGFSKIGKLLSSNLKMNLQSDNVPLSVNELNRKLLQSSFKYASSAAATATVCIISGKSRSANAAESSFTDYAAVKADIVSLIKEDKDLNKGPTLVRLAWHSSGTYDKMSKTGGSGKGTIRFKEELAHGANNGLQQAVAWLEPIYQKYHSAGQDLSYADLYTYAGIVAIETLQGPKIPWRAGRVDSMDPADVTPNGRLPEADLGAPAATAAGLRAVFGRMGFNDQELVALSGAHALGRCHLKNSGYEGPWTYSPFAFNNAYYILLSTIKWIPDDRVAKLQYTNKKDGDLMMLPSDLVLLQDDKFKKFVDLYAADQGVFFKDFTAAFQKLQELGTSNLRSI